MSLPYRTRSQIAAAVATACAALTLASAAGALDLRDWGRKFPADQRFVVLSQFSNEAVLDKETQLVWERQPDPTLQNWYSADYQRCGLTAIGGRLGWRLPSWVELMTLLDPSVAAPVKLPTGHPFIGIVEPNGAYWTSSRASNPDPAYDQHKIYIVVSSAIAVITNVQSGATKSVWCVRGPSQ